MAKESSVKCSGPDLDTEPDCTEEALCVCLTHERMSVSPVRSQLPASAQRSLAAPPPTHPI